MSNVHPLPKRDPVVSFHWVEPDDVPQQWDLVRPGVERVARLDATWRAEDVYMALRQGASHLHVVKADGEYAGFVVTTPSRDYGGVTLHVWAAYAVPGMPSLLAATTAQLHEWARNAKARRLVFYSPRKGWDRVARKLGFAPTMTVYECEVAR